MESSFLDSRLQSALHQSSLVQSQLRLTVFNKTNENAGQKSRGKLRRSNTIERPLDKEPSLIMGKLLLETGIKATVRAFLGRDKDKFLDLLVMKILRMRPVVPQKSTSFHDPLDAAVPINKDKVLYASSKQPEEQLPVVQNLSDIERLRNEVSALTAQQQKLSQDYARCKSFYYHMRTSDHLQYYYYMQRLYHARKAFEQSKVRPASGSYLSAMFDLKCHELKVTEDMISNLSITNSILQSIGYNLSTEVSQVIQHLIDIDEKNLQAVEKNIDISFQAQLAKEEELNEVKLKALDERMYKVIQGVKYISNVASAVDFSKHIKVSEAEEEQNTSSTGVNYEELYNKEMSSLNRFNKGVYKDLQDCMERCYSLVLEKMEARKRNLQYIREMKIPTLPTTAPQSRHDQVYNRKEKIEHVLSEQRYLSEEEEKGYMTAQERQQIFTQHTEKIRGIQDVVQQRRNAFLNQVKARMNTLYTATQSRSKSHSFIFSGYPS